MRERAKRVLELLMLHAGPAAVSRRVFRRRTMILAYHNILPHGEPPQGDRSLHLPQAEFARQLDHLAAVCDVVSLADATQNSGEEHDRPRVAITFDDGYLGALSAGVDELTVRGLPGTFFVAPAFLGGSSFWWDSLAMDNHGLPESVRGSALNECRGIDPIVRDWAQGRKLHFSAPPPYACAASEAELTEAAARPGITLGSHSWSHPNLARLASSELREELERPLRWLRERFDQVSEWLSYPYGLTSGPVEMAAREVGYRGGLLISGGWLADGQGFSLPRLNVPAGLSLIGFRLRVAGLLCT